mgnify:CR=1 FL=1
MSQATPAALSDLDTPSIAEALDGFTPKDLEGVQKATSFRRSTLLLLTGEATVDEWQWHTVRTINRRVDLPYLTEDQEGRILHGAFEAVGYVLENLLRSGSDSDLAEATIDLLSGEATTDEWIEVAKEALDATVNIPYVPAFGEDIIFDRGVDILATALEGLLKTEEE